jgi:hypothetical protein
VSSRAPGAALLHPWAVGSLLLLVLNDHVLKPLVPGFWTGKLSDFAGMALVPLFLQAVFEIVQFRHCRRVSEATSNRVLLAATLATAIGFSLVELVPAFETAYRVALGGLQWPFLAVRTLSSDGAWPALRPVRATADATDLLALPMACLAYRVGRRGPRLRRALGAPIVLGLVSLASCAWPRNAQAAEARGAFLRDGFYLGGDVGLGAAYLSSSASISNGFRQRIASTAVARVYPAITVDAGGTIASAQLVVGARVAVSVIREPHIDSVSHDREFVVRGSALTFPSFQLFTHFYPDLRDGLYFGGALGLSSLEHSAASREQHTGYSLSLEAGYRAWISPNWSLGGVLRVSGARLEGQEFGVTTLISPTCAVSIAWH